MGQRFESVLRQNCSYLMTQFFDSSSNFSPYIGRKLNCLVPMNLVIKSLKKKQLQLELKSSNSLLNMSISDFFSNIENRFLLYENNSFFEGAIYSRHIKNKSSSDPFFRKKSLISCVSHKYTIKYRSFFERKDKNNQVKERPFFLSKKGLFLSSSNQSKFLNGYSFLRNKEFCMVSFIRYGCLNYVQLKG